MSATEITVSSLPSRDALAWVDYVVSVGTELAETLASGLGRGLERVKVSDTECRPRKEFEPMSLEKLGSFLLLGRELEASAAALRAAGEAIGRHAHVLYQEQDDTPGGVVATVRGVEPYAEYRRWHDTVKIPHSYDYDRPDAS